MPLTRLAFVSHAVCLVLYAAQPTWCLRPCGEVSHQHVCCVFVCMGVAHCVWFLSKISPCVGCVPLQKWLCR